MPLQIPADQRRARLGVRHLLSDRVTGRSPAAIAGDLVVLHATDPATVYLSVAARSADLTIDDISAALYEQRSLIRMLGMRRTMFVVPTGLAPVVQHSSTAAVAARLRRALVKELTAIVPDADKWLTDVEDSVVRTLRDKGSATSAVLAAAEPRLRTSVVHAQGRSYGGPAAINSRLLNILSAQGRIVRGRTTGGWTSSRYQWAPVDRWLPGGQPEVPVERARMELVSAWLARFGPATVADVVWWTGWNLGDTRRALAGLETAPVDLDGVDGLVLASDTDAVAEPEPWVALVPALDPTAMGWAGRDWYLEPDHRAALFDRTGNIGPSVWCNGRIVGGWGQGADGRVRWRLLEDIGAEASAATAAEAARLETWMSGVRVVPKFRTPLERELASD